MDATAALIFFICALLIVYHYFVFPIILIVVGSLFGNRKEDTPPESGWRPLVSILVTCFNEGEAIPRKVANLLEQDYPKDKLDILVAVDGADDDVAMRLSGFDDSRVRLFHYPVNRGKIHVINDTAPQAVGDVILFTDVDALLARDAVRKLVDSLAPEDVGGVCGLHRVPDKSEKSGGVVKPQSIYWSLDTLIKKYENRLGSITSCYGTIYAIKKALFTPVPPSVTDDAFQSMGIVRQGKRFGFQPEARAFLDAPSKHAAHELSRRKRIVLRSLRGLWISRELFNIRRFGWYSLSLFSHKVLRRLLPVFLLLTYLSSMYLAFRHWAWLLFFLGQTGFYGIALMEWLNIWQKALKVRRLRVLSSSILYFCVGNIGTFLGLVSFLRGEQIDKWTVVQE